ncbi:MAG: hypothetical protein MJ234_05795, partial [bacterium]|nr:hypothetical protein [bacterium]
LTIERPVSGSSETERAVILGSSLMAGRQGIKQGENLSLLLNSMAWLSEEKNLIAIRPKDSVMEPLSMTPAETSQFFFKTVIAIPFMIVALWLSFKIAKRITRGRK